MKLSFLFYKKMKSNGRKPVYRAYFGFSPTFLLDLMNFERQVNSSPEMKKPGKLLFQLSSRKQGYLVSYLFSIHFLNSWVFLSLGIFFLLEFIYLQRYKSLSLISKVAQDPEALITSLKTFCLSVSQLQGLQAGKKIYAEVKLHHQVRLELNLRPVK